MMGTPLVVTLGQLLSLGALVVVIGLAIWLWRRQRKPATQPAFLKALTETGAAASTGHLQEEINGLRVQLAQLRQEVEALKASRPPVAANYTQAIEMARQGQPVVEVANRCGISRAEAELIVAMHGGKDNT